MTITSRRCVVEQRFEGPRGVGNGGYVGGLLAAAREFSSAEVTLHRPTPVDAELDVRLTEAGAELWAESLLATLRPCDTPMDVLPPPSLAAARAASEGFVGHHRHAFPNCFVCGVERKPGEGLRIFPGPTKAGGRQIAAVWRPGEDLADKGGRLRPEFMWAALDCPGYFAVMEEAGVALLGRMQARVLKPAPIGTDVIVTAWPLESSGRKHQSGSALHGADGELLAFAHGTWISVPG